MNKASRSVRDEVRTTQVDNTDTRGTWSNRGNEINLTHVHYYCHHRVNQGYDDFVFYFFIRPRVRFVMPTKNIA